MAASPPSEGSSHSPPNTDVVALPVTLDEGDWMQLRRQFAEEGFIQFNEPLVSDAAAVRDRLDRVDAGAYETGVPPTKTVRAALHPTTTIGTDDGGRGASRRRERPHGPATTGHMINVHRSDSLLRHLVTSPAIGELVARLTGWSSVRLAQDQSWVKPPGAGPLTFHRDSPYLDFDPPGVVTVWLSLDDLSTSARAEQLGSLEYCVGSHLWDAPGARTGVATQFYDADYRALLVSAASRHNFTLSNLRICRVCVPAGGVAVHDGRTWHGSGPNASNSEWRRGIGIHYIPGHARFRSDRPVARIWQPFKDPEGGLHLPDDTMPLVWPAALPRKDTSRHAAPEP